MALPNEGDVSTAEAQITLTRNRLPSDGREESLGVRAILFTAAFASEDDKLHRAAGRLQMGHPPEMHLLGQRPAKRVLQERNGPRVHQPKGGSAIVL